MGRIRGGAAVFGTLMVLGAAGAEAQGVEGIMRARDRLELSEDQLSQLDEIRRESVQRRTAEMAQLQELRSQLDAGQIRRSEVMAFMEDRREERQALAERQRERVEAVLTEAQLETLQDMRRARRAGVGGRPGGRRDMDGPGFAPRRRAEPRGAERPRRGPPGDAL